MTKLDKTFRMNVSEKHVVKFVIKYNRFCSDIRNSLRRIKCTHCNKSSIINRSKYEYIIGNNDTT